MRPLGSVGWLFVLVCCWWVLGSLVLPMVLPLVSGVSAGEGVVASGLGVGGGAGVGVVVPGPGVGRGRSGVTGCGRSPLLAAGLVGPPLRPSGFWRPCSPPGGLLGSCCLGLCVLRVWCGRRLCFGVWCALVGLVSVAIVGVCVVCTLGRVCGVLVVRWGACPRLCGRGLAALFGVGAVCRAPPPCLGCVVPRPPWLGSVGGVSPCCPLCVCPPPSVSFPCRLGRCRVRAFPAVVCGEGSLSPARVPSPGVSPWGSRCLHSPSGCNSVVRMPSMDLFRSQVLQPFPTPGSGTLWVAGESSRDRRVSCLPRWTVCPTRSPSLGPNRSTCRGECSWSGPLVTPPGRCHRGPLTNGPGRIPPYCVCSGGADTVTGGAPKPLRLGPSPAPPVGPFRPVPLFAVRFAVVGVPSLRGGVVVVGGGGVFAVPGCVACGRVAPSSGPAVVVRGVWCVVCGGGVLAGLWVVCGVVGPSPLLAEVPVCYSPPLLAGFRCRWWWAVPATPGWGPLAAVVCGVWRWCVGCWSLATPGGGSCVLLPATPGWVSLPVVVGGPRHSWLGSAGGGGVWCVAVVCWLLVPRHSWRRFLCATPRHSWLGFAAGGGAWCAVCGVRRVACGGGVCGGFVAGVVGPSPLLAEVPVCYSPPLLAGFRCRWWWAVPATPGWGPLAAVVCGVWRWCVGCWSLATPGGGSCVLLPATPGWVSLPVVVGGPRHSWLGSAGGGGVWCVAVVCWLLVPRHSWRRFLCATPCHSWLGFAAGGGAWCECVVCGVWRAAVACVVGLWLVWLVPRHSWRRFLCATPRHSWLGFAAGGGGRSPPLLAGVRWRRWCVVCGGGVLVVGPSPLLAEVPVCYSPPLLAGFRCRWWWAVPATPGWGPLAAVVCGVWRWCVGCWSLATPGGGSCVLLPATPGWVSLPAVVRGVRCVVCGVWRAAVACVVGLWLVWLVPRHSWRRFLCATPRHSWLGFAAGGGGRSPPLLAGVRWRRWCVVCGGGVLVVDPSPLLAEVPVCYSPPLLAGFRCRRWCVVCGVWCAACGVRRWRVWWVCGWCGWSLATPGGGSCVLLPATPGWVSLPVVVGGPRHSWLGSAGGGGVWCVAVVCWLLVPRHSWRRFLCATPRHSWLGFAAGGGGRSPPLLAGVRWRRWCVVCGGGVLVVGPSPLLAEVPVCYSLPLLAGFRCRRWCVV